MAEGCYNCTQAAIEAQSQRNEINNKAQEFANIKNEWVGIYTDPFDKQRKFALASVPGLPFDTHLSPQRKDPTL